jgi:hypothetical protein
MKAIKPIIITLLLLIVLMSGIKSDSLWIDEAETANYALQPTFSEWQKVLISDAEANCQFPLYMLGIWEWEKITGPSEYALRAFNILFAMLAIAAFYLIGRELGFRYLWGIFLIQPFFWFYLNEARPYMLQLGSGAVLLAGLILLIKQKRESLGWVLFIAGTLLLFYSTLLSFVTLTFYYLVLGVLIYHREIKIPKNWAYLLGLLAVMIIPGGVYYLETVLRGAQGARFWEISPMNFVWVYYELTGAIGLGPSVFKIRDMAHDLLRSGLSFQALSQFVYAGMLCGSLLLLFMTSAWKFKGRLPTRNLYSLLALIFIGSSMAFVALSILLHKAFWARHLAPLFPLYCLILYKCCSASFSSFKRSTVTGALAAVSLLLLALSISSYLFSKEYIKDDNKKAAHMVLEALGKGQSVWWGAASQCAWYYGLPVSKGVSTSDHLKILYSPQGKDLASLGKPDIILLNNRYDIFDDKNSIRNFAKNNNYKLSADNLQVFTLWEQ